MRDMIRKHKKKRNYSGKSDMISRQRIEAVGRYIDQYYEPYGHGRKAEDREVRSSLEQTAEIVIPDEMICDAAPMVCAEPPAPSKQARRRLDDLIRQMDETFSQKLIRMIRERGMRERDVYKKACIDRRHFSKIKKNKDYAPNKKTVLAFSIALGLTLDETKDLLRSAGYALSRSSKFDIIVAYFLENKIYDVFEINEVLYEYGQQIFE